MADRVRAVARHEISVEVEFELNLLAVNEMILPEQQERAHFIVLLFRCALRTPPDETLRFRSGQPHRGERSWRKHWPEGIMNLHQIYERFA